MIPPSTIQVQLLVDRYPSIPSDSSTRGIKIHKDIWEELLYCKRWRPFVADWVDKFIEEKEGRDIVLVNVAELNPQTATILGNNNLDRFNKFKEFLPGWDYGEGKPLSLRSAAVMQYFANRFSNFTTKPSIFLSTDGNLELAWENNSGQAVELEFFPDKIEYYVESIEKEDQIDLKEDDVAWLIDTLKENQY
jgi:hypothetical protein